MDGNDVANFDVRTRVKASVEEAAKRVERDPLMALALLVSAAGELAENVRTLGGGVIGIDWPTAGGFQIVKLDEAGKNIL